jgi:hypothetical protein
MGKLGEMMEEGKELEIATPEEQKTEPQEQSKEKETEKPKVEENKSWFEEYGLEKDTAEKFVTTIKENPSIFDEYGKLKEASQSYESKIKELEAQVNINPYANDAIKDLNELAKTGADPAKFEAYLKLQTLDLETINPLEAKKYQLQLEKGWDKADIDDYIELNYKLDKSDYDFDEDDEAEVAKVEKKIEREQKRLRLESKESVEFLGKYKKDLLKRPDVEAQKVAQKEFYDKVDAAKPALLKDFKLLEDNLKANVNGKELEIPFSYDMSDQELPQYLDMAADVVKKNNLTLDQKGLGFLHEVVRAQYFNANKSKILSALTNTVSDKIEEAVRAELNVAPRKETVKQKNNNRTSYEPEIGMLDKMLGFK